VISLALVAVVLFVLPTSYTEFVIGFLMLAGAWEWSGFVDTDSRSVRIGYTALVAACLAAAHHATPQQVQVVIEVACVWWFFAFLWTLRFPTPIPVALRWVCGILVIVPLFVALCTLLRLGVEYLIYPLLIVWLADGGAYFAGKKFGRVKLAPAISPGKTWEGVVGGFVLVSALGVGTAVWQDLGVGAVLPLCLAVAAISVVGDLTVSMFKRTAGVKDSGTLFPGHGGVLDRVDSIAAAAPLFVLGLSWFGLA